jgi:8-oxo-dGTP pyrophosphatase MutT (NUDIX family)
MGCRGIGGLIPDLSEDRRLQELRDALATSPPALNDADLLSAHRMEAAVSIVVRAGANLDFLLIKRAISERDPWSGHMALPGGRWDQTDAGLIHTARRETREETGVDLGRIGVPLGRLQDVSPSSTRLPDMRIAPFVFGVPPETEAYVASPEVDRVYWVPLDTLSETATGSSIEISLPDGRRTFPSYHIAGEHVWGLTHRILSDFLRSYR